MGRVVSDPERVGGNFATLFGERASKVTEAGRHLVLKGYAVKLVDDDVDEERRIISAMVSMASRDRAGDTISPPGWKLENHRANPVVLFGHQHRELAVGRAVKTEIVKDGLFAVTEFADHAFALEVFDMYALDFMRGWSVGFDPLKWIARYEQVEGSDRFTGYDFQEQDLLEYSTVNVGMHPGALTVGAAPPDLERCAALGRAIRKGHFPEYAKLLSKVASTPGTPDPADERDALAEVRNIVEGMLLGETVRSLRDRLEGRCPR